MPYDPDDPAPQCYRFYFLLEDATGQVSGVFGLSYQLLPSPVNASDVDVSGTYTIHFTSEYGRTMDDTYTIGQVAVKDRIAWAPHCDDAQNQINCFHMRGQSGSIDDSENGGATFKFHMSDGFCWEVAGSFAFQGNDLLISRHKSRESKPYCNATIEFPAGEFSGLRIR